MSPRRRLPPGARPRHARLERRPELSRLVLADKEITGKVPRKQIEHAFDLQRQLKNVDKIFARVFATKKRVSGTGPRKSSKKR